MRLTDRVLRSLDRVGPGTARELSAELRHNPHVVQATLCNLHRQQRVRRLGVMCNSDGKYAAILYGLPHHDLINDRIKTSARSVRARS